MPCRGRRRPRCRSTSRRTGASRCTARRTAGRRRRRSSTARGQRRQPGGRDDAAERQLVHAERGARPRRARCSARRPGRARACSVPSSPGPPWQQLRTASISSAPALAEPASSTNPPPGRGQQVEAARLGGARPSRKSSASRPAVDGWTSRRTSTSRWRSTSRPASARARAACRPVRMLMSCSGEGPPKRTAGRVMAGSIRVGRSGEVRGSGRAGRSRRARRRRRRGSARTHVDRLLPRVDQRRTGPPGPRRRPAGPRGWCGRRSRRRSRPRRPRRGERARSRSSWRWPELDHARRHHDAARRPADAASSSVAARAAAPAGLALKVSSMTVTPLARSRPAGGARAGSGRQAAATTSSGTSSASATPTATATLAG